MCSISTYDILPLLPGDDSGSALGINDDGWMVGAFGEQRGGSGTRCLVES